MKNSNPSISESNEKFTSYVSGTGEVVEVRKDNVSFVRLTKNNRGAGYLNIVGMTNNSKSQHEFFNDYESAIDFLESMINLIGEDEFTIYENDSEEVVAIRKDDVSFVRNIKNKDGNGRVIIVGLMDNAKDQHEFFKDMESAEAFKKDFLESL